MFVTAPITTVSKEYLNKLSLIIKVDLPTPMFEKNKRRANKDNR